MSPAFVTFFTFILIIFAFYGFFSFLIDVNRFFKRKAKGSNKTKGKEENRNESTEN